MGLGIGGLQSAGGSVSAASVIPSLVGQDIVARSISLTQASGLNAVQLLDGARLNFSPGDSRSYLYRSGANTIMSAGSFATAAGSGVGDVTVGGDFYSGSGLRFSVGYASGNVTTDGLLTLNGAAGGIRLGTGSVPLISNTAPTISSGFGTAPSVTLANGTAAFRINVGTGGVAQSGVIGLPTATNGWNVFVQNLTNPGASVIGQTGSTTNSATIQNYSRTTGAGTPWAASDILAVIAFAL